MSISDPLKSFKIKLVLFRTFGRPLVPKPFSWLGVFCSFYSKTALVLGHNISNFLNFLQLVVYSSNTIFEYFKEYEHNTEDCIYRSLFLG